MGLTAGPTGWRRLVLCAAFVQCLLSSGVVCNSHVFFEDFRREFGASAASTGETLLRETEVAKFGKTDRPREQLVSAQGAATAVTNGFTNGFSFR